MARERQTGRRNVAGGDDRVIVQAGSVHGRKDGGKKPEAEKPKGSGRVVNVVSGNARVGIQADEVRGPIHIRMEKR